MMWHKKNKPLVYEPEKIYTLYVEEDPHLISADDWQCYTVFNRESLKLHDLPMQLLASKLMKYLVLSFKEDVEIQEEMMSSYNICLKYPFQGYRMHIGIFTDVISETDLLKALKGFSEEKGISIKTIWPQSIL